jgi:hypothetical protein
MSSSVEDPTTPKDPTSSTETPTTPKDPTSSTETPTTPKDPTSSTETPTTPKDPTSPTNTASSPKTAGANSTDSLPIPASSPVQAPIQKVPLTFVEGTSPNVFHKRFKFTETRRQTVMSDQVTELEGFFRVLRESHGIRKRQIKHYYLYSPVRYSILKRAYMRFQPKLLGKMLKELGVIRYIYFVGWDRSDGKALKRKRWDLIISNQEIVGREAPDTSTVVPLTFVEGTSRTPFHDNYFRFTETGRQTVMSNQVNGFKKFSRHLREVYSVELRQVERYYLNDPVRYPILKRAYMRFQPELLSKLFKEIGVTRYVYFVGWEFEDGKKLKQKRYNIILSDREIVGREEPVDDDSDSSSEDGRAGSVEKEG